MNKKKQPAIIELSEAALKDLMQRAVAGMILDQDDSKMIRSILSSYDWIYQQLKCSKLSIKRMKTLFGFKTEKRKNIKKNTTDDISATVDPLTNGLTTETSCDNAGEPPCKKNSNPKKPKWDPKQNHGRIAANEYSGCDTVVLSHPTLQSGSACPSCAAVSTKGTLYSDASSSFVRLIGTPLITGTQYQVSCLRCALCSERFQAPIPAKIKNAPKYDVSCSTALAIGRYSMGLPMYRIEQHQTMYGIPMKDSTQYDLLKALSTVVNPVLGTLIEYASNGELMIYDDTTGRILENKAKGLATHTTAFISVYENHKIILYFTGRNHAGKNTEKILSHRTSDDPVIAMMDASPSNIPKNMNAELLARFIICFCLTHGRRKFFELFDFFDKECDFVLDIIGEVYKNDAHCKAEKFSAEKRLEYHQEKSQILMESLYIWLNNTLLYETREPNSGLGSAIRYMLKHWIQLTTFLRVAGAPLDSSWAERSIKIAIRHRRNSLFYKTSKGAEVGDCLMSLIYTAAQNGANPFDYLNALQRNLHAVQINPEFWLPWNYIKTMADIPQAQAA